MEADYYKYQKEIEELKSRLKTLKSRQHMRQLNDLNVVYKDLNECVKNLHENVRCVNEGLGRVSEVLDHDNKIPVGGKECAENLKSVLNMVEPLVRNVKITGVDASNLTDVKPETFANDMSRRAAYCKLDCNAKRRLIANVDKLIEKENANNNRNVVSSTGSSNDVRQGLEPTVSDTMSSVFTFCEDNVVASSPLPDVRIEYID